MYFGAPERYVRSRSPLEILMVHSTRRNKTSGGRGDLRDREICRARCQRDSNHDRAEFVYRLGRKLNTLQRRVQLPHLVQRALRGFLLLLSCGCDRAPDSHRSRRRPGGMMMGLMAAPRFCFRTDCCHPAQRSQVACKIQRSVPRRRPTLPTLDTTASVGPPEDG